jgi:hypothetical protein
MRCWCRWVEGKGGIFNFGFLILPAFAGHAFAWIIGECECGGRADGLLRPIERFTPEWFNRRITDDAPYRRTGLCVERRRSRRDRPT